METQEDRRQYYRIEVAAMANIQWVGEIDPDPSDQDQFLHLLKLQNTNFACTKLLQANTQLAPTLKHYLQQCEARFDQCCQLFISELALLKSFTAYTINLSVSGMSIATTAIPVNERNLPTLAIRLLLKPTFVGLDLRGKLLDQQQTANQSTSSQIQFLNQDEYSEQNIARFILQQQARGRRRPDSDL